jgi:aryl-alcohol dehydrogenase-like predicted oxidoreductase
MQYQELGNTGLFVSRLCLGAMTFGGGENFFGQLMGGLGQKEVDGIIGRSIDSGINFIDTANVYAAGESEILVGKAIAQKRKDLIVATKVFGRMGPGVNQVGASRGHIMDQIDQSLRRLGTDYIDLYQIHGFDSVTPMEETMRALNDVVRSGKVRYIGVSNWSAWQIMKSIGISERQNLEKFCTLQAYYSLAGRDLDHEIVAFLKDQKVGLLTWSPLAGGFLSGKFTRGGKNESEARRMKFDFPPLDVEKSFDIIEVLQKIARRHERASVAQIALSWQLHQSYVTSVIIGAKNETQLNDNIGAAILKLTSEDLAEIEAVSRPKTVYPNWMFEFQSDRKPGTSRDLSNAMKPTV